VLRLAACVAPAAAG